MKTLTLLQPWASLVACGQKRIETRSWRTKYRGPMLIHSSGRLTPEARALVTCEPFATVLRAACPSFVTYPESMFQGCLVAKCELVRCDPADEVAPGLTYQEHSFGDYTPGRWAWILDKIQAVRFPDEYRVKGKVYLWDYDGPMPEVVA